MENVFAYLRVSDPSQVKDKEGRPRDGFIRQEKACREAAAAHGMQIVEIFREAVTGTESERPVLAELLVSLELNHHGVRTVIIEKLDRLARDLMIQESIIGNFAKKGFNLVSAVEGADLLGNDPTRKFIRQVLGAVAELDKTLLVAKLRASRDRKRASTGRCEGRMGYRDTEEGRAVIMRIRELMAVPKHYRRPTLQQVADTLNAEGFLTMKGKPWTLHRVARVYRPTGLKPLRHE
jgi:DNA invertase Pin-like site-specific DNA recombinase